MKKILIHSPYWNTLGGGERYSLTVASCLQDRFSIFVSVKTPQMLQFITQNLELDLSRIYLFDREIRKINLIGFHGIFWVSDGSIPFLPVRRRVVHFQAPFRHVNGRSIRNRLKLVGTTVVCNSLYTKERIDREFGMNSKVLYPPVEVEKITPGKKDMLILSVGRFSTSSQHKRQDLLVDAFKLFWKKGGKGWRMVIVGRTEDETSRTFATALRRKARGFPIAIRTNLSHDSLRHLYRKATLYWHAAGYGVDLAKYPERAEHFGISTVEAMAAGAIPCSFSAGGQTEIIADGVNGILWRDPADLVRESLLLISHEDRRRRLSEAAQQRAKAFSRERFCREIQKLF